jgi:DNA-binding SARP family transcriptional activator
VVVVEGSMLSLAPGLTIDVQERVACARRILEGRTTYHDTDLDELVGDGDLLADWYEDWLLIERERLRQLRLHALEALGGQLLADGRFGSAVEAGLAAVNSEPLRESAQRLLISAHLAEGNAADALRQYDRYSMLLGRELGLAPSAKMTTLVSGLRQEGRSEARRYAADRRRQRPIQMK